MSLIVKRRTPNDQRPKGARNAIMRTAKDARRIEAFERNKQWAKLTPKQQLAELDKRFGVGVGCKKQRARLAAAIS